jgi:hypothetical protein
MPYTVSDVSGNTALSYKVTPYYSGTAGTASSSIAVTTNVQTPLDLSAIFIDASSIKVSFTVPKNTYSSSVYYTLRSTDVSGGTYKDVSGTSSPIWITNLSGGKVYNVVAKITLDGSESLVYSSILSILTNYNPNEPMVRYRLDGSDNDLAITGTTVYYTSENITLIGSITTYLYCTGTRTGWCKMNTPLTFPTGVGFTISFYAKIISSYNWGRIFECWNNSSSYFDCIMFSNKICIGINGADYRSICTVNVNDGVWRKYVFKFSPNGTNMDLSMYINNTIQLNGNSTTITTVQTPNTSYTNNYFFNQWDTTTPSPCGIFDFRMYYSTSIPSSSITYF